MQPTDDSVLLRQFAENHSDEVFAALVQRHINLVYSVALRHVGNPHHAEEIAQAVFIILAKKAAQLHYEKALSSWLFQTTRLTANNFIRSEMRRQHREQEAYMQTTLNEPSDEIWSQIAPLLDGAVAALRDKDRRAVLLRFYEGRSLREVGAALGSSEDAAEKRVNRALEKLRNIFNKSGTSSTTAILAETISANSVQAAPAALAKTVTIAAMTKGATASTSTLTLIKGVLNIMAWTKAKTAIVVGIGLLLVSGTTTVTVKEIQKHHPYPWQVEDADSGLLDRVPPQVKIVPSIFSPREGWTGHNGKLLGMGKSIKDLMAIAYDTSKYRVIFPTEMPQGDYDFIANLPAGSDMALRREIERKFNLIASRTEMRESDVLLLTVKSKNAPGLRPGANRFPGHSNKGSGHYDSANQPLSFLAGFLEYYFEMPVVDRTGLPGRFDINIKWAEQDWAHRNPDALKQVLLNQLGLELVPSREPIKMLVVEKAN